MFIIEILLGAVFAGIMAGGIHTVVTRGVTSKRFNAQLDAPAAEPRKMIFGPPVQLALEAPKREIPEDIRRELDESYEMSREGWDAAFHANLEASPSREVLAIQATYSYNGGDRPNHHVLKDCTCTDCTTD